MSDNAKVSSIDAIADFRVALIRFAEDVTSSLTSLQMEVNRSREWIEHDRPTYWKRKLRKQYDVVATARQELSACKRRGVGDKKPSCIEEEQAYKKARRRLEEIEEIINTIPRWKTKLSRDGDEYKARVSGLQRFIDNDIEKAILILERMTTILDEYTHSGGTVEVSSEESTTTSQPTPVVSQPAEPTTKQLPTDLPSPTEEVSNSEEISKQES